MQVYQGHLRTLVSATEDIGCQHEELFHTLNGEILKLKPRANTPRNQLIEIYVENDCIVHFNVLMAEDINTTVKNIALMRVLPPDTKATQAHWDRVTKAAQVLEAEYRKFSRGRWQVDVTPYVIEGYGGNMSVTHANWTWLRRQVSSEHNYWHGWGGHKAGICGHAWLNSNYAWTFINCSESTMIHEQGHNFNLHHTGTPTHEYGETTWMGSGVGRGGFHAPHQRLMGWTDDESSYWLDANTSQVVHLIPADLDPAARMPGMFKGVVVAKSYHNHYMVSLFGNQVRVHKSIEGRNFSKTTLLQTIQGNNSTILDNDGGHAPVVKLLDSREGMTRVSVKWSASQPEPAVPSEWPRQVWPDNLEALKTNHSGLYMDRSHKGQGFDFWFRDHDTTGYWFTFDRQGNPQWLYIKGEQGPEDGVRHCELFFAPREGPLEKIGWVALYKTGNHKMRLHYYRNDQSYGVINLDTLAYKHKDSRLSAFKGVHHSGVSTTTTADGREVGYVYGQRSVRGPLGWSHFMHWRYFDVDASRLYTVSNGAFRVATETKLEFDSVATLGTDQIEVDGETITLHDQILQGANELADPGDVAVEPSE